MGGGGGKQEKKGGRAKEEHMQARKYILYMWSRSLVCRILNRTGRLTANHKQANEWVLEMRDGNTQNWITYLHACRIGEKVCVNVYFPK